MQEDELLKQKKAFIRTIKVGSCATGAQIRAIGISNEMIIKKDNRNDHVVSVLTKDGSLWIYKYESDLMHCVYQRKSYKSK